MSNREDYSGQEYIDHIDVDPVERKRWLRSRTRSVLITDASQTPSQNRRHRETVYTAIQAARVVLLVIGLIAAAFTELWQLALLTVFVTIPLPWIAVVIANDGNPKRDKREQAVYKPAVARALAQEEALEQRSQQQAIKSAEPRTIDATPPPESPEK